MARRDARSLDHATLEEMRRLAVKRVLDGEARIAVAESLQVHAGTVAKWMMRYYQAGDHALASTTATRRFAAGVRRNFDQPAASAATKRVRSGSG